ncbi:MAG: glycosyltransferase [Verrucomicrobiales bacterium]|nr:MAG: glycosyltransferase [Verrucomicrobiaceae bacterium]
MLLVIPCYKESTRLPDFLQELCKTAEASQLPIKILTVDDGSGPEEAELMFSLVQRLQEKFNLLLDALILEQNQGKGGAIYSGWNEADPQMYKWIAFVDADGAISPEETLNFLSQTKSGNKEQRTCLWSVRVTGEGKEVNRTKVRQALGNIFRSIVKFTFNLPVRDTQCGLKCLPTKAYQKIQNKLIEKRFVFDIELAAHLTRQGYKLKEIPVNWHESPGSTINIKSAFKMLFSLFVIRWRLLTRKS